MGDGNDSGDREKLANSGDFLGYRIDRTWRWIGREGLGRGTVKDDPPLPA